jgi:response regulator RpfG family c-di-GMP phosphodiesterase
MVNDRPFKTRMTKNEALQEIKEQSGRQFDPILAEIFINVMEGQEKAI